MCVCVYVSICKHVCINVYCCRRVQKSGVVKEVKSDGKWKELEKASVDEVGGCGGCGGGGGGEGVGRVVG